MSDEQNVFTLANGKTITDTELSKKLIIIEQLHPDTPDANQTGYSWDEIGLADVFGQCYREDTRYCVEHKCWYTYADGKWQRDEGAILVSEKIKEFCVCMNLYCWKISNEDVRKNYMKFLSKLGDRRFRDRVLKDAMGVLEIRAREFDNNPYLINCLNGTFDLRNFEFRHHDPNDLLTFQTNFSHSIDLRAKCERWERFINEITENDKEKADYLQRALGYSLLGLASEECMFILYGKTTRNGKSTLLNTIEYMLGDYADVADTGLISKSVFENPGAANPSLAKLKGKRFVSMSESSKYGRLDESAIKQMTGGEAISARALYQSPITFTPQFKLWLSCNDLPDVKDRSLFASDRLRVIEFTKHFSHSEQDKNLKHEFQTEENMRGIFNWLLTGYKNYLKRGLTISERLKEADIGYEQNTDIVYQFLMERCETDPNNAIRIANLYESYKTWSRGIGEKEMNKRQFFAELRTHTDWYDSESVIDGYRVVVGLRLKDIS